MLSTRYSRAALAAAASLALALPLPAQQRDTTAPPPASTLEVIGSAREDRARLQQLVGSHPTEGFLLRSPSTRIAGPAHGAPGLSWSLVAPIGTLAWNSGAPYTQNDGALWAGRGMSVQLMAGVRARLGRVSLVLAPQVVYAENRFFGLIPDSLRMPSPQPDERSDYASAWFGLPGPHRANAGTIDAPTRFGDRPYALIDPGQSSLTVSLGPVAAGAATENHWWGPGIRNAIVLSNHAAGIPHLFLRTNRPLATAFGEFEGRWLAGGLTESLYFDTVSTNETRSFSAAALTFRPRGEPGLTLGVARAVYGPADGAADAVASGLDAFVRWPSRPEVTDTLEVASVEQVLSIFGRWVFPESGFAAHAEWSRQELPVSFRDLLTMPNHTQGYTLGLEWARPVRDGVLRLQGETTFLEKSATFRHRPGNAFYTSEAAVQGYTQRGQVVGAAIGPGSSSQWLSLDHFRGSRQVGLFLSRIRWEAEGLYNTRSPIALRGSRSFHARDVSLIGGVRTVFSAMGAELALEYAFENRYNFLFQNPDTGYASEGAVDVRNHQLRLTLTPRSDPD